MRIPVSSRQTTADNTDDHRTTATIPVTRTEADRAAAVTTDRPAADRTPVDTPVAERKPRASLLATIALILAVSGAFLVLSGPLLGYGIGVAGLALVLSLAGLFATRKRHVAGKTDALIGLALSIGAVVIGVLALTGSLDWLGTDMQPASDLRNWLDSQFETRF